jgi:hypothetical protein
VSDLNGNALDFSLGAKLSMGVTGIIATSKDADHDAVVKAAIETVEFFKI